MEGSKLYEQSNGQNPTIVSSISRSIPCPMPLKPQPAMSSSNLRTSSMSRPWPSPTPARFCRLVRTWMLFLGERPVAIVNSSGTDQMPYVSARDNPRNNLLHNLRPSFKWWWSALPPCSPIPAPMPLTGLWHTCFSPP